MTFTASQSSRAIGQVSLAMDGDERAFDSRYISFAQAERYFDGSDIVVIHVTDGDEDDLRAFATSLRVGIDVG